MAHETGLVYFNLSSLKQDCQDPWLMSLLLGIFCAPRAAVVAYALGIAEGKATLNDEVLTSKQCADEQRCEQHPWEWWAYTSFVGGQHRAGALLQQQGQQLMREWLLVVSNQFDCLHRLTEGTPEGTKFVPIPCPSLG